MIYNLTLQQFTAVDSIKVAYKQLFALLAQFCLLCCFVIYCVSVTSSLLSVYVFSNVYINGSRVFFDEYSTKIPGNGYQIVEILHQHYSRSLLVKVAATDAYCLRPQFFLPLQSISIEVTSQEVDQQMQRLRRGRSRKCIQTNF